jgi:DNA-directed RNA polymerase specialized sigma24 family protein
MDWDATDPFARPAKLTPEEESELIAGWLSREEAGERRFVDVFRPFLRAEVRVHWPRSWKRVDDLEQDALVKLVEWRDTAAGREKIRPPLAPLAKELVERPARILRREKKHLPLENQIVPVVSNQEQSALLGEMLELASNLPRGGARTLLAHAEYVAGEGPEVAEALGLDATSAHKRLVRAQAALIRKIQGDEEDNG